MAFPRDRGAGRAHEYPVGKGLLFFPPPWGRRLLGWREAALDFLYPSFCPLCGEALPGGPPRPCRTCLERLEGPRPPFCPSCGLSSGPGKARGDPCPGCARKAWFPGKVAAPFFYRGAGGELVRALKFEGRKGAGIFLGAAMVRAARAASLPLGPGCLLVPVPLHPRKRRKRGIHQAGFLAEEVGRRTGAPVLEALSRRRDTLPQGDPLNPSREKNVAGAFAPRGRKARKLAPGKAVILVDDVATSGATARECRRVLLGMGAASVDLLVACRVREPRSTRATRAGTGP